MTEQEHHHHFAQEATPNHDDPPVWSCTTCGYKPDPEQDAVAKALAEEDGWIGENVRNAFAWELHLQRAQRVIAVLDEYRTKLRATGHNHPHPIPLYHPGTNTWVSEDSRWEIESGCPACKAGRE
jgi:rubredoxin